MVEYLIKECGVDPLCRDDNGNTPLHSAVKSGDRSVVALLITEFDCEPDVVNKEGKDPAAIAEESGHKLTSEYLRKVKNLHHSQLI